jgi:hypothetical protein
VIVFSIFEFKKLQSMKLFTLFALTAFFLPAATVRSFAQASTNVPVAVTMNNGASAIVSTAPDSRGWTDPALNHNRLLQQKIGDGVYKLIGTYKVIGNCYLFGEYNKGDIFTPEAKAWNISISYNTYNQEVEFYSTSNPDKPLMKEPGEVDSFSIHQNLESDITSQLIFIYGPLIGAKDKVYFQELCTGKRFNLYKKYKSELGYVSSNYIQSELRQFDLQVEYYYTDSEGKGVKKIKPNAASVIKEFKEVKDLSAVVTVDDFTINPEAAFKKAFDHLNN